MAITSVPQGLCEERSDAAIPFVLRPVNAEPFRKRKGLARPALRDFPQGPARRSTVSGQFPHHIPQALVEHQVRLAVIGCFVPVDQHQAAALVVVDQAGGGVDR